jgi:hypothetical protein
VRTSWVVAAVAFTVGSSGEGNSWAVFSAASCCRNPGSSPCRRCIAPWSSCGRRRSVRRRTTPESATASGCRRRRPPSVCSSCSSPDTKPTPRRVRCPRMSPCRCSSARRSRCSPLRTIRFIPKPERPPIRRLTFAVVGGAAARRHVLQKPNVSLFVLDQSRPLRAVALLGVAVDQRRVSLGELDIVLPFLYCLEEGIVWIVETMRRPYLIVRWMVVTDDGDRPVHRLLVAAFVARKSHHRLLYGFRCYACGRRVAFRLDAADKSCQQVIATVERTDSHGSRRIKEIYDGRTGPLCLPKT